jgi:hypothetical protein
MDFSMSELTLSALMSAVTLIPESELQNPVEVLALLKAEHPNALLDAHKANDRTAYLAVTTASADPVTLYAEEPSVADQPEPYMTYGMLKMLGQRLGWQNSQEPVIIESAMTAQGLPVRLNPIGVHGSLIIAKET